MDETLAEFQIRHSTGLSRTLTIRAGFSLNFYWMTGLILSGPAALLA